MFLGIDPCKINIAKLSLQILLITSPLRMFNLKFLKEFQSNSLQCDHSEFYFFAYRSNCSSYFTQEQEILRLISRK
jgi:hypothetical protein